MWKEVISERMKGLINLLRRVKAFLTDRRGYNDMMMIAKAIILMVIVAVVVYISILICDRWNLEYPLLVPVAIGIVVGVISFLLGGFGVAK